MNLQIRQRLQTDLKWVDDHKRLVRSEPFLRCCEAAMAILANRYQNVPGCHERLAGANEFLSEFCQLAEPTEAPKRKTSFDRGENLKPG